MVNNGLYHQKLSKKLNKWNNWEFSKIEFCNQKKINWGPILPRNMLHTGACTNTALLTYLLMVMNLWVASLIFPSPFFFSLMLLLLLLLLYRQRLEMSKPSTIGWSFRMANFVSWHGGILAAASKARRLRYSIDENGGAEVETWRSLHAETQQRWWTEEYWTGHVNEEYTAGLAHQRTTKSAAMTSHRISASRSSYPACVIAEDSRKSFNSIREAFDEKRSICGLPLINDLLPLADKAVLIRQEGISTTAADGLEFVQMEEDRFQFVSTMWIRPD